jgi:ornithine cyclodeaminase/alanine dehydrogenase-like protein (mu-crystallin family)
MLFLNATTNRELLPPAYLADVMADAMKAISSGAAAAPARTFIPLPGRSGGLAIMPALPAAGLAYGVKLLSVHPDNPARGRPLLQGLILLFDDATGEPAALVDAVSVTALRTAAVSALATRLLSRPDARSHGILGTGVQAAAHFDAILAARPGIKRVVVWSRSPEKAEAFARQRDGRAGVVVVAAGDASEAAACDVVSVVTASAEPVLLGEAIAQGAHINLVGSHHPGEREADTKTILRAKVFVDSLDNAMREAGDLLIPIGEGAYARDDIAGEIGQLLLGIVAGRSDPEEVTLFKSLGHAVQDIYAANAVHARALARGRGQPV